MVAAHRRQIAEWGLGDRAAGAFVMLMLPVLDRVNDEVIGKVGGAFAIELTLGALKVFFGRCAGGAAAVVPAEVVRRGDGVKLRRRRRG